MCAIPGEWASCSQGTFGLSPCSDPTAPGCFCAHVYGDATNCGACGNVCASGSCRDGVCG
jgi:hypothetical protein